MENSYACQSPGGRGQDRDREGGEEDSTIIMKGLYFVESLPCLISSCGWKSDLEVIRGVQTLCSRLYYYVLFILCYLFVSLHLGSKWQLKVQPHFCRNSCVNFGKNQPNCGCFTNACFCSC